MGLAFWVVAYGTIGGQYLLPYNILSREHIVLILDIKLAICPTGSCRHYEKSTSQSCCQPYGVDEQVLQKCQGTVN